jgi:glyoxylase-like metal-dependent hydrolase (beta-lactamase superfamily II)
MEARIVLPMVDEKSAHLCSHFHWDHTGNPSTFPETTALMVGPGTKANFLPGYPVDPTSHILESDYAGRELHEVEFANIPLKIGPFRAIDWFGDGSFYLLDSPGVGTPETLD